MLFDTGRDVHRRDQLKIGRVPLAPVYDLSAVLFYKDRDEQQLRKINANTGWGESDSCDGSPRERGSSLCPQDLTKLIEDCSATHPMRERRLTESQKTLWC
jgi:hypothetical protein